MLIFIVFSERSSTLYRKFKLEFEESLLDKLFFISLLFISLLYYVKKTFKDKLKWIIAIYVYQ